MKVMLAATAAIITKNGFVKAAGGVVPVTRSLMMPPPVAVRSARILTPKMSIFFLMPAMAPDTAKATVPMISITNMKSSVFIADIIYVFAGNNRRKCLCLFDSFLYSK